MNLTLELLQKHMGVSKNRGKTTQIIHLFMGFSIIFTIHFGGVSFPLFLVQHPNIHLIVGRPIKLRVGNFQ